MCIYVLYVVCCLWFVGRFLLVVDCRMCWLLCVLLFDVRCLLFVGYCVLFVVGCSVCVACCLMLGVCCSLCLFVAC